MMCSLLWFRPSKIIGGGGGGVPRISYSAKVCYCFREIFEFCDFMNSFMIFAKYITVHKIDKLEYLAKEKYI